MNRKQAESLFDILEKLDEIKSDIRVSVTDHFSCGTSEFDLIADIEESCDTFIGHLTRMLETPADSKTWLEAFDSTR